MKTPKTLVQTRPAETGSVAGFAALLIARALGLDDPDTIIELAGVIAFLPAGITWLVTLIRGS